MANVHVIQFPTKPKPERKAQHKADGFRYFTEPQIKLIRRTARDRAALALQKGAAMAAREWALLDLLTSTGLRESEAADLRCGDLRANYGESAVFVRCGKGCKSGTVQIPDSLRQHLKSFLKWKEGQGEPVGTDDHVFVGQRGPWTGSAVAQIVKQHLRRLGLYEPGKSAHSLTGTLKTLCCIIYFIGLRKRDLNSPEVNCLILSHFV